MTWLELDDRILEHPKFIRAVNRSGSEAVHLWLGIRAYCGQNLTDGHVPIDMMSEVRGPTSARKRAEALETLIVVGLIEKVDDGIVMHDFLDWSESRAEIIRRREAARERKSRSRDPSQRDSMRDGHRDGARSLGGVTNPRGRDPLLSPPDPDLPPVVPLPGDPPEKPPRKSRKKPGTPAPDTLEPTDTERALATKHGVNLSDEIPQMLDFHRAKGTLMSDWLAGLRTWIRNAPKFRREGKPPGAAEHETTRLPSNYKLFPVVREVGQGVGRRVPEPVPKRTQATPTAEQLDAALGLTKPANGEDPDAERERWEREFRAGTGGEP